VAYRAAVKARGLGARPARSWLARLSPPRPDLKLALAVGAVQLCATYLASRRQVDRRSLDLVAFALLAAGPAALVARRRHPGAVLVVAFMATFAYWALGYKRGPIFLALIAAYVNAVTAGRRLLAWLSIGVGYVSFLWLDELLVDDERPTVAEAVGLAAWLLVLAAGAEVARARRERAAEAARSREEEARRRESEERLRVARELHDVLAHNISLINVQAGVALHLMDERPEQARTALAAIKQASKEALGELRSVLGVLRQVDDEASRAPAPGLERLDGLVAAAEGTGLPVRVELEGARRPLPAGVDLAAFRIVQEALTNVARHAGPASATVRVTYGEHVLTVQVDDDGRGTSEGEPSGGGNGIAGMRERAAALGGQLEAGPRPDGGFRVLARLPLGGAA
jgi:signal transduction histidine kinase